MWGRGWKDGCTTFEAERKANEDKNDETCNSSSLCWPWLHRPMQPWPSPRAGCASRKKICRSWCGPETSVSRRLHDRQIVLVRRAKGRRP